MSEQGHGVPIREGSATSRCRGRATRLRHRSTESQGIHSVGSSSGPAPAEARREPAPHGASRTGRPFAGSSPFGLALETEPSETRGTRRPARDGLGPTDCLPGPVRRRWPSRASFSVASVQLLGAGRRRVDGASARSVSRTRGGAFGSWHTRSSRACRCRSRPRPDTSRSGCWDNEPIRG